MPPVEVIEPIANMPGIIENGGAFGVIGLVLVYLFSRLSRIEKRLSAVEKSNRRLAVLVERIGGCYERVRDELLAVYNRIRVGGDVDVPSDAELEARHPLLSDILSRPVDLEDDK